MNTRRKFIRETSAVAGTLISSSLTGFNILKGMNHSNEEVLGHNDYQYRVIRDWAQISSVRTPLLNCHEMVMDSKGRLIMIGDHPNNNILIFDKSGTLLDFWGTAYPGGHGLSIHSEGGEDYLYLTDSGWYLNKYGQWTKHNGRVTKTTLDGKVIFDIGHPQTIGIYNSGDHFCPTEVAVAANGDIYVADGYGADYIIQYDHNGRYIRHWGGHDNKDMNYNLSNAHGVAIDDRDPNNLMVVCTSRNEEMFKWFTLEGKYIKSLHLPNMQVCRPVFDDINLYAGVCWSQPKEGKSTWKDHTGFVTILEGDQVVSNPGGAAPVYKDGELENSYQLAKKPILHGHDVCVDEDKNIYICQWNANNTPPLKLERI